jgi:dolichyl-phosphate-mannose--protein O-mannosyl transferase
LDITTVTNQLNILKNDGYVSVEQINGERWTITALGKKLLEDQLTETSGQLDQLKRQIEKQEKVICYREIIQLIHKATRHALHSHNILYSHPNSSGQQQVTAFAGSDDNNYWIVKGQHALDEYAKKGHPLGHGDIIRLEHQNTRKNLHSHSGRPSPVTGQQEVTGFGQNGIGDDNDNWRVETSDGETWKENAPIRLIHVLTNSALHSHAGASSPYTSGQQEVTSFPARDANDFWIAEKIRKADS